MKDKHGAMRRPRPVGRHLLLSYYCVHSPWDGNHPSSACLPSSLQVGIVSGSRGGRMRSI